MLEELGISQEDWERTPPAVRGALQGLQHQVRLWAIRCTGYERQMAAWRQEIEELEDLKAEVAEMRERLGMTSKNSSKPPSSDPPQSRPRKSDEPTGRARGGQPGHPGSGRPLKPEAEVDEIIDVKPISCTACGHRLLGDDPEPARHQVSEIPPVKVTVTEYRRHTLSCPVCGTRNQAPWPGEMPTGQFGPRGQAIISYLTGRLSLSHREVVEGMQVLHGLEVSLGSIAAIQRRVSEALAEPMAAAQQFVQQQQAQHVDETSWSESQQRKWLWVNAGGDVTVFRILDGRGTNEAKQIINPAAKGTVSTDRLGSYNFLVARRRQICWAHLKRDFQAMIDRRGQSGQIGKALLEQERKLFQLWHRVRDGTLSRGEFGQRLKPLRQRVKNLLQEGTDSDHKKTRRTCTNILKVEPSLWTFVRVEGVEPTNNDAERPLRRAVLWRRKSFGTQSETGSRFVERILTVVTSLRQQGRDVLEFLTAACSSLRNGSSVCLLPQLQSVGH